MNVRDVCVHDLHDGGRESDVGGSQLIYAHLRVDEHVHDDVNESENVAGL